MLLIGGLLLTIAYVVPPYLIEYLGLEACIYHALRMVCYMGSYTFFVATYVRNAPRACLSGWRFVLSGATVCIVYSIWGFSSFWCMSGLAHGQIWSLHQTNTIAFLAGVEVLLLIWSQSISWQKFLLSLLLALGRLLVFSELVVYIVLLIKYYPNHVVLHSPGGEIFRVIFYFVVLGGYGVWLHYKRPLETWSPDKPAVFYYAPYRSYEVAGSLIGGAIYTIEDGVGVFYSFIICKNKCMRFTNGEQMVRKIIQQKLV